MPITKHAFNTEEAAMAFIDGVEYANDSSLTVIDVRKTKKGLWEVSIADEDQPDNEG